MAADFKVARKTSAGYSLRCGESCPLPEKTPGHDRNGDSKKMRIRPPSSRARVRIRYSLYDVLLAAVSPLLALYIRDAYILSGSGVLLAGTYCLVSFACTLLAYAMFGVQSGIARYYSVHDIIDLGKAVVIAALLTCVVLFVSTRLEGIPRSTPAVHALLLGVGLVTIRALAHVADKRRAHADQAAEADPQHVIVIGVCDLSVLYMRFLEICGLGRQRVIALLDAEPRWIGSAINGVRIYGPPSHLESLIEEFALHGIRTDRVVLGEPEDSLSDAELAEIRRACTRRGINFMSVSGLFDPADRKVAESASQRFEPASAHADSATLVLPRWFRFKRPVDFVVALTLIVVLIPLWLLVAGLAAADVGAPIVFWQQRVGVNGRNFLLYKVRTLRSIFDASGQVTQRLSWIGRLWRKTRIDELPQLLNVLTGEMSLIGPRPLLSRDQPPVPGIRLMVRPGITGWAQVNGGTLLSPQEKEALDEEYVRHASLWFDLRIVAMTVVSLLRGDRRSNRVPAQPGGQTLVADRKPAMWREDVSRFTAAKTKVGLEEKAQLPMTRSA
jgi:lipopolysaccharide/colanic/teichoic acid biosynthesis glycosyltransferase